MYKRSDYLEGKIDHDTYYIEIAKEVGIRPNEEIIQKVRKALSEGDKHLNSIPLQEWDVWAVSVLSFNGSRVSEVFKKHGDQVSQAGLVCMLKAICRYYAQNSRR